MEPPARTSPPPRTGGHFHQAAFHSSAAELLAVVVPFLLAGVALGEPTVVVLSDEYEAMVRDAMPADGKVDFFPAAPQYLRPATTIRGFRALLAGHVAAGARQVRLVGEVPPALFGDAWDAWARYESAVNHAYDDFPLRSMCVYDRVRTPARVLDDIARTHPYAAVHGGGHVRQSTFLPPSQFLSLSGPRHWAGGVPPIPPHAELRGPSPAEARQAVLSAVSDGRLGADALDDLTVAVSETVTNAHRHGTPPVTVRLWSLPDRVTVAVSDAGTGPANPFAGLLPAGDGARGGLGLWVTHQCCDHVTAHYGPDGYTVTMTMNVTR
ncbi:sensor histidine kinase [Catenuloplanes japonicus]|uniref:sensor histidine kinase n=1 Tax=Catenuloplanes japonicus TaxID=33876 RepID=UPI000B0E86D6|nr:sensor histidine kinase [Catenuloplanes japonicus]